MNTVAAGANRRDIGLGPFVPRVASDWNDTAPGQLWRPAQGTLVFVDISGFTALSERLAQKGRIGAEELTTVLNRVFGRMLEIVYERGGALLKFGGDALLLIFTSDDHAMQACAAVVEMRATLRTASNEPTSVGKIQLKMSSGIHSGSVDFFLVGESHRELIVTGPAASVTTEMESAADAGEIVVSSAVVSQIPEDFVGQPKGTGWLLRKRKINHAPSGLAERTEHDRTELAALVPVGLRDHLSAGIDDSEHRIAAIGFVKFKGVDALLTDRGPEEVASSLEMLVTAVQGAADEEGVTFLASDIDADGGKIILAAGVPSSQHDDEGRILRVCRQILDCELDLTVRIGVNRGHVFSGNVGTEFRRTYTVMGDTVNLAARLMAAAEPGSLYSAPSALNISSTLFRTEPIAPFYVKGKEQPVQAFRVLEDVGVRPPELATELPFHGREAESGMLVGIVNTCSRLGRGGMMTITGPSGIGKSRLIAEVLERCSGMATLTIQSEPNGVDNPYWAFRDPLRRELGIQRSSQKEMARDLARYLAANAPQLEWSMPLLGDVLHIEVEDNEQTSALDASFRPDRTAEAVVELLSLSQTKPLALVAEDGQWLDEASLGVVKRIGEVARERPWTVLITARDDEDFERLGDEIRLTALDEDAIRVIAIEVTAAAPLRPHELDAVVAKVDGNPLFLSEILWVIRESGSADELPESLGALVTKEIDTLRPLTRQILRYASVLGRSFRFADLNEILAAEGLILDGATEAEMRQFIEPDLEGRSKFRHSVVHDAAYEGLSFMKRRELHSRAGDLIKRRAGRDLDPVVEYLAHHYFAANSWSSAFEYSMLAGAKADAMYANVLAATFYERAVTSARQLETVPESQVATLHETRGDALERAGLFDESLAEYRAALKRTPDDVGQANLMFKRARLKAYSGNFPAGLAELSRATRNIEDQQGKAAYAAKARLHSFRSVIRMMQGRPQDALSLADTAKLEALESDEREALARSYMVLDAACLTLGRPTDDDYLPGALAIYEGIGDLLGAALVYNNMGERAWLEGELDNAISLYSKAGETSRRAGNEPDAAMADINVGEVLIAQGRLEEAAETLGRATRILRAHGSQYAVAADIHLARVSLESGDVSESVEMLVMAAEEANKMGQEEWTLIANAYLASAHRRLGDLDRSLELLGEAESVVGQGGDLYRPLLETVRSNVLRDKGDLSAALDSAKQGRDAASELGLKREQALLEDLVVELETSDSLV